MWELDCEESWALKNWCFWTVVLEKSLESPLDCKEIQLVILKEISLGCSLEEMMLKLKLQYFGHLMWRVDSLVKTLMLGKVEGRRKRGRPRMRRLDGIKWLNGREFEWTPGVGDTFQPSNPLLPPFPPALNLSQHQSLFQWVGSSHQVAKILLRKINWLHCLYNSLSLIIFKCFLFLDNSKIIILASVFPFTWVSL